MRNVASVSWGSISFFLRYLSNLFFLRLIENWNRGKWDEAKFLRRKKKGEEKIQVDINFPLPFLSALVNPDSSGVEEPEPEPEPEPKVFV